MPIPKPNKGETQKEFIPRCMAILNEEFPDNKQRSAVCYSTWRAKDKKDEEENRSYELKLDYSKSNFKIDKETGFLTCTAYLTRSGVFDYKDENGNLIRELRSEKEVFDKESLDSLKLKPIILTHDAGKITVDNIKDFQKGTVGEIITKDDKYVKSNIIITDKDTIDMIIGRKQLGLSTELSCGYRCKVDYEVGEHPEDGYYTFAQKNIKYNHVSIVDKGRAGRNVRILDEQGKQIDFVYGVIVDKSNELQHMKHNKDSNVFATKKEEEKTMADKKTVKFNIKSFDSNYFKMDGLECTVPEEALEILDSLNKKLTMACDAIVKLSKEVGELKGKNDQLNETITTQKNDIAELTDLNSERMKSIINTRNEIIDTANKLKIDHVGKSNKDTMVECIKAVSDGFDPKDKDENYIKGRFDTIKETIGNAEKNDGIMKLADFVNKAKQASSKGSEKKDPRAEFIKMDEEKNRK